MFKNVGGYVKVCWRNVGENQITLGNVVEMLKKFSENLHARKLEK
jgi:hypothetical protein